jgi:hypothetical protein
VLRAAVVIVVVIMVVAVLVMGRLSGRWR